MAANIYDLVDRDEVVVYRESVSASGQAAKDLLFLI